MHTTTTTTSPWSATPPRRQCRQSFRECRAVEVLRVVWWNSVGENFGKVHPWRKSRTVSRWWICDWAGGGAKGNASFLGQVYRKGPFWGLCSFDLCNRSGEIFQTRMTHFDTALPIVIDVKDRERGTPVPSASVIEAEIVATNTTCAVYNGRR